MHINYRLTTHAWFLYLQNQNKRNAKKMCEKSKINFAICKCFFQKNVFISIWQEHVQVMSRKLFNEKYFNKRNRDEAFSEMEEELERRRNFYPNLKEMMEHIRHNYKPKHKQLFQLRPSFFRTDFIKLTREVQ